MGTGPQVNLDLHLPADEMAAGVARRTLDGTSDVSPEVRDRFRLAVSELVTNAVKHGSPSPAEEVELVVRVSPALVRVEVVDPGPGFDYTVGEPVPEQESGWGLYLVDRATDRWGIECDDATMVWFEIDLPAGARRGSEVGSAGRVSLTPAAPRPRPGPPPPAGSSGSVLAAGRP